MAENSPVLFDAGMFIGALLEGDPRHSQARPLVEAARVGDLPACTTSGILSEVYAALTWMNARPQHTPEEAANGVRLLIEPPSAIRLLSDGLEASLRMLEISERCGLTARRTHDARHAATALVNGVTSVYTYDAQDWRVFESEGMVIAGPLSTTKPHLKD